MKLKVEGNRLTLRPPRFVLGGAVGLVAFLFLTVDAIVPFFRPFSPGSLPDRLATAPWFGLVLGLFLFFAVSRNFRGRIVMDREANEIREGSRAVCRVDQVTAIEVDTKFRTQAMNTVTLLHSGGADPKMNLLLFDGTPRPAVWHYAEAIAAFLKVPIKAER